MAEISLLAQVEKLDEVMDFVNGQLEAKGCAGKAKMEIDIAVEEIFVNIASYAYSPEVGPATIQVEVQGEPLEVSLTFIDSGIKYNPLEQEDPDIELSAEERPIGGLGIYMIKKSMDNVRYEYKDGKNVFTICKQI